MDPVIVSRHRKPINRKTKLNLVFNEKSRREFLTGFHKRKLQRQKNAKDELEAQLKEERKRIKMEAKDSFKKMLLSYKPIPDLEDLQKEEIDCGTHTVSVTELSLSQMADTQHWIGINKVRYEGPETDKEEESNEECEELPGMELKKPKKKTNKETPKVGTKEYKTTKDIKKELKKQATKKVKQSKVFQKKNRLEQRKQKKKSLRQKKERMKIQSKSKKGNKAIKK